MIHDTVFLGLIASGDCCCEWDVNERIARGGTGQGIRTI